MNCLKITTIAITLSMLCAGTVFALIGAEIAGDSQEQVMDADAGFSGIAASAKDYATMVESYSGTAPSAGTYEEPVDLDGDGVPDAVVELPDTAVDLPEDIYDDELDYLLAVVDGAEVDLDGDGAPDAVIEADVPCPEITFDVDEGYADGMFDLKMYIFEDLEDSDGDGVYDEVIEVSDPSTL